MLEIEMFFEDIWFMISDKLNGIFLAIPKMIIVLYILCYVIAIPIIIILVIKTLVKILKKLEKE